MLLLFFVSIAVASSAEVSDRERRPICIQRNKYHQVDNSCDVYIECRDFIAHEMKCPDGLYYNPKVMWPAYPCGYPTEISCTGRDLPQPAYPTGDCPHQFGFFPTPAASENNCGMYRMCVGGRGVDMQCPRGLAFNPETASCDWPDMVPTCDAHAFLGFQCPDVPASKSLPEGEVFNYKHEASCFEFFSCVAGRARLLTCDAGMAFAAAAGKCVDADLVPCAHN